MNLGCHRTIHKVRTAFRIYANQTVHPFWPFHRHPTRIQPGKVLVGAFSIINKLIQTSRMFVSSSKQHSLSHCHMPGRSLRRIQPHTKQKIFRVFLLPSLEAFLLDRVCPSIMLSAGSAAPLGPNSVCSIVFTRWQGWPGGGHHDHSAQLRHNITILIHLNITPRDMGSLTNVAIMHGTIISPPRIC